MISMFVASAVLIISNALMLGVAVIAFRRFVNAKQREISQVALEELAKLVKGEPCQSGSVLNAVGRAIGAQAGTSAKAALMADLSHAKREANSLAVGEQVDAIGAVQPALGNLLTAAGPRKAKGILGHPLAQLLMQLLTSGGFGSGGNPGNGATSSSQYQGRKHRE